MMAQRNKTARRVPKMKLNFYSEDLSHIQDQETENNSK